MGVVITYDTTDKKTFEHVEFWAKQLDQHGSADVKRVLVGNKTDLADLRTVSTEEGKALADKFGMDFFETSAKTGASVDDAFLSMVDQVVQHRYSKTPPAPENSKIGQLKNSAGKKKSCPC
mmetsp:Transcript_67137/g.116864  ORF Transcript_67137/g.116864 Transcript_67137/m.116864 type:complete len:121 (+) Transcript_67137:3-365(+)